MKKTNDNFDNSDTEVKKLLSHLIKILNIYSYDYSNYYNSNGQHETEFYDLYKFNLYTISVDSILGSHLSIHRNKNTKLYFFIMQYFKSISGLKVSNETKYYITYDIIGDVDDIIKQITIEDFDYKYEIYNDANKFNL